MALGRMLFVELSGFVLELPSPELVDRLGSLGLCTRRDLKSCGALVRRLAQDLPPFDVVWIDALVQQRRLTRYQGNALAEPERYPLDVGPFLIQDQIGSTIGAQEYRAKHRESGETVQLLILDAEPQGGHLAVERLQERLRQWNGFSHPAVNVPHTVQIDRGRGVIVSPWIEGERLGDLLVRRGRFPVDVVWDIALQLISGLAFLEQAGRAWRQSVNETSA
ncbi:MAG: hypothetical protein R3C01_17270 [Planctomycetaceae bacterium]